MKNILTILKINILSLVSLPILFISIVAKLLQKAVEKTIVFIGVGVALLALSLLNMMFNNRGGFLDGLGTLIAVIFVFGSIIAIVLVVLFFFGSIAAMVIAVITSLLLAVFEGVFQLAHEAYSKLYDICKTDFEALRHSDTNASIRFSCIFWYILVGFNRLIVTIFSLAFPISLACAVVFGGYAIFSVNSGISKTLGIGIFQYLKLFPTTNVVFTVLYFVIVVLAVMIVFITLGIEWNEWGNTLKYATQEYEQYKATMNKKALAFDDITDSGYVFAAGKNLQRCEESMELLRGLFDDMDFLHQQVDAAINLKSNSLLAYDLAAYIQLLEEIHKELERNRGNIACDYFENNLIPLIEMARKKAKNLEKAAFAILNTEIVNANKKKEILDFFGGCETKEEIQKRYKSLCKVYHPDVGGHEDTFKQLQGQYEQKIG